MSQRNVSVQLFAIAGLSLALVASWVRPLSAQRDPEPAAARAAAAVAGSGGVAAYRYQVVAAPREMNPYMILVDTKTGHTWTAAVSGGGWTDRGIPAGANAD